MTAPPFARVPLLLLLLLLSFRGDASADDEGAVLRARAAQLAGQDRCAEALPVVRRARALAPEDAAAARLEGECLFHERRYADAVTPLEDAVRLDPGSGEAALLLAMARYHAGDAGGAAAALERAEALQPQSPEVALYRGLVLLEAERSSEAAERLERAVPLGWGNLEPAAVYYTGLAHAGAGDRQRAEAALRRVSQLAPGSEWAQRAEEALASPEPPPLPLRRWLRVSAGLDYDDNVTLRGDSVPLPSNISSADDGRGWWSANAGGEVLRRDAWGAGLVGSYYGSAQFSASRFDEHFLSAAFWVDRTLGEDTLLRVQPEFGQGFLNDRDYRRSFGVVGEALRSFGRRGSGRLHALYRYHDYRFRIVGTPAQVRFRDRDGHEVMAGYDHFYDLDDATRIQGGPLGFAYRAEGGEYDFFGVGAWLGVERALPLGLRLAATGRFQADFYDNNSSFGGSTRDRRDLISSVNLALHRSLLQRVTATLRWGYRDNESNTRSFDYDRHIVGGYLTFALGD